MARDDHSPDPDDLDDEAPVQFVAEGERADAGVERFPFQLAYDWEDDDERDKTVLHARRPKTVVMARLFRGIDLDDDISILGFYDDFIAAVLEPESKAYVEACFDDEDHNWDVDVLAGVIRETQRRWWPTRPTSRSGGSTGPRSTRRSGKRSKGR